MATFAALKHRVGGNGGGKKKYYGESILTKIEAWDHGKRPRACLGGMRFTFADGTAQSIGGSETRDIHSIDLLPGDYIESLTMWKGPWGTVKCVVTSIKITTSTGQTLKAGSSKARKEREECKVDVGSGLVVGFEGRRGAQIDNLALLFLDIDARTEDADTALMWACEKKYLDVARRLVQLGADKDAQKNDGNTALITAAAIGHVDMVQYLVEQGADKEVKDKHGYTALIMAARNDKWDVVQYLVEKGADINAMKNDGTTALIFAATIGHVDMVQYLVDQGADTNANDKDDNSPLILLLQRDDVDEMTVWPFVRLLLEHNAFPFQTNKQKDSAKSIAARRNFYRVINLIDVSAHQRQNTNSRSQPKEEDDAIWLLSEKEVVREHNAFARGSPGTLVYMAKYGSAQVVMKKIEITSDDDKRRFRREMNVWKAFSHPNVVTFYGISKDQGSYYMVSAFAKKGNLIEYLKNEKQVVVWRKLKEVADGLKYLHDRHQVIHGDLKGNNIVVSATGTAKLVDFGMSFYASGSCSVEAKKSFLGAMHWRAPEYAIVGASRPWYDSDVYSLGMCIIQAVKLAEVPWGEENLSSEYIRELLRKKEPVIAEKPEELTEDQWKLVKSMIALDRKSRPPLNDVIEQLTGFADEEKFSEVLRQFDS